MVKFRILNSCKAVSPEITYVLNTWARNQAVAITFTESAEDAVAIGSESGSTVRTASFRDPRDLKPDSSGFVPGSDGRPDVLATAFYMLNSIQEHQQTDLDELGRFRYTNSYQSKLGNAGANTVQHCFDEITRAAGMTPITRKTRFFLSHDIDTVNGAILEDGFNVLKKGRIDLFLRMLVNVAMGRPDWLNMDKIMKLESEYDCKSVFFWIVNRGRINKREVNADYSFSSNAIQRHFKLAERSGFENGLHKSISSETFAEEFSKYGQHPVSNRYHYLKFQLPKAYHDIENAKLKLDASLGFAEEIGFRNSYGLPFNPFNLETRRPFSFIEVPLHVMDRTYFQYKRYTVQEAERDVIEFFEKNNNNCVLSVLWHNNFFSNYKFKGYLDLYKKILSYIRDGGFGTISQSEIIRTYSIT